MGVRGPTKEKGVTMVEIQLPKELQGKSEAEVKKLFNTFLNQRVTGQAKDKANRAAMKDLIDAHKPEYEKLVAKYTKS